MHICETVGGPLCLFTTPSLFHFRRRRRLTASHDKQDRERERTRTDSARRIYLAITTHRYTKRGSHSTPIPVSAIPIVAFRFVCVWGGEMIYFYAFLFTVSWGVGGCLENCKSILLLRQRSSSLVWEKNCTHFPREEGWRGVSLLD